MLHYNSLVEMKHFQLGQLRRAAPLYKENRARHTQTESNGRISGNSGRRRNSLPAPRSLELWEGSPAATGEQFACIGRESLQITFSFLAFSKVAEKICYRTPWNMSSRAPKKNEESDTWFVAFICRICLRKFGRICFRNGAGKCANDNKGIKKSAIG